MNTAARITVALLGVAAILLSVALWTEPATFFLSIVGGATLGILWILWWIGDIV